MRYVQELHVIYARATRDLRKSYASVSQDVHVRPRQEVNARYQCKRFMQNQNKSYMRATGEICKVMQPLCDTYLRATREFDGEC